MVSSVEIGPVFLEERTIQFRQCVFAISLSSPLGKGNGPSVEQTSLLTKDALCQV